MSSMTASNSILTNSINAIVPSTGDISIGTDQTAGILNLGTGTGRTSLIAIGSSSSTTQINILTSNTNNDLLNQVAAVNIATSPATKLIRIGSSAVNGTVTLGDCQVNTLTGINGVFFNTILNTTRDISIGSTQTTGKLNIGVGGNVPGTRAVGGDVNIANQPNNTCNINIMNGLTTAGSVNIANGTGTGQSTAVNIGTGTTTGTVTIGNSANTTTIASGTTNIGELKISGNFLNNSVNQNTGAIYIGGKQTSGVLYIGNGDQARGAAAAINIGNNNCPVNILTSGGYDNGGSVNIANGSGLGQTTNINIAANTNTGTVKVGNPANITDILSGTTNINTGVGTLALPLAGTVNIATGTGVGFVSTAVNIGTGDTTGAITIGSASSTATVGIRNPRMTLSYTAVPTLTSSQIGYTFTVNAPTTLGGTALVVTGAQTAFLSIASVPIGLWLVNYATRITGTGVATNVTKYQTWINITNQDVTTPYAYGPSGFGTLSMPVGAYNSGISQSIATNGSGVIKTVTSTGTISLTYMATVTPATSISFWNDGVGQPSSTFLTITRIG